MNLAAMMQQANKLQNDLKKAQADLEKKEFSVNKSGMVTVTMTGDKKISKIDIDEDALEKDNKDLLEEAIKMACDELIEKINEEKAQINLKLTGRRDSLI